MGSSMFGKSSQSQPVFIPPPPPPPAANPPTFANAAVQAAGSGSPMGQKGGRGQGFGGTDLTSGASAATSTPTAKQTLGGG